MTRLRDTIQRVQQALDAAYDSELHDARVDVTPQQLRVLDAIWNEDGPSQTTLVNVTYIDRSTMADIVKRLVLKGLVARRRGKDARKYVLSLTPAGKQTTLRAQLIAKNVEDRIAFTAGSAMKGMEKKLAAIIAAVGADGSGSSLVAAE